MYKTGNSQKNWLDSLELFPVKLRIAAVNQRRYKKLQLEALISHSKEEFELFICIFVLEFGGDGS